MPEKLKDGTTIWMIKDVYRASNTFRLYKLVWHVDGFRLYLFNASNVPKWMEIARHHQAIVLSAVYKVDVESTLIVEGWL